MPEPYWAKKAAYPLSRANDNLQLVRVRCNYCKRQHIYQPTDLIQVYGDRDVDSLMQHMICDGGSSHGTQDVKAFNPMGKELIGLRIRRLAGIKVNRVPVWRDD